MKTTKFSGTQKTMKAPDMFVRDLYQVFSTKTGDRLGYQHEGDQTIDRWDPENETQEPETTTNPNQLKLF